MKIAFQVRGAARVWPVLLLMVSQLVWAAVSEDKKRVIEARAKADAELAAQEAECQQRFAVTPCLLEARERHRAIVDPLRRDELMIDERERRQRGAERQEHLKRKALAAREAASAASAIEPLDADSPTSKPLLPIRPRLRSASEQGASVASSPALPAETASESPRAKARHPRSNKHLGAAPDPAAQQRAQERVQQFEERRARVLERNAERNAKKPPAAPLPVPGAVAASAPAGAR